MYSVAILIYETRVLSHFVTVHYDYNMFTEGNTALEKVSCGSPGQVEYFAGQVTLKTHLPKG